MKQKVNMMSNIKHCKFKLDTCFLISTNCSIHYFLLASTTLDLMSLVEMVVRTWAFLGELQSVSELV